MAASAARPTPRLDGLPVELLARIALYAGRRKPGHRTISWEKGDVSDLLALRSACRACVAAVRQAAMDHAVLEYLSFRPATGSDGKAIEAKGQVFGSGCRNLRVFTNEVNYNPSADILAALRSFAVSTRGRLLELYVTPMPYSIGRDFALELCRASPQLKELTLRFSEVDTITGEDIDEFCAELSGLCPLLEHAELSNADYEPIIGIGEAESYAKHFPNKKRLKFCGEPDRYAAIEETVRACARADEVDLSDCTVRPALMEVLLRTPLRGRLKKMDFYSETEISPHTVLQCARGFEMLTHLSLPDDFAPGLDFYRSLVQARPTLKSLELGWNCEVDDACLRVVCDSLSLERLRLTSAERLSPAAVDTILQSRSAQTLRTLMVFETPVLTSTNMLRLVRGCPLLNDLHWCRDDSEPLSPIEDGPTIDAINELLKSRGGKELDPFEAFGPYNRLDSGLDSGEEPGEESGEESGEDSEDGGPGMDIGEESDQWPDHDSESGGDWLHDW